MLLNAGIKQKQVSLCPAIMKITHIKELSKNTGLINCYVFKENYKLDVDSNTSYLMF